jgi:tetratricopeptide (TPR) repeat protein
VSENTDENKKEIFSLEPTRPSISDEVASAKILFQEGLYEEAKKILYRALMTAPGYRRAEELLAVIQKKELDLLMDARSKDSASHAVEDPDLVIRQLVDDLQIEEDGIPIEATQENFKHSTPLNAREHFDLGVGFFEMGCYRDAIRELEASVKLIRQESTELGQLGVSAITLQGEALLASGEAFAAKMLLDPVVADIELKHDEKNPVYYVCGRVEEALGNRREAKAWYQKVANWDDTYRDAAFRLKRL